MSLVHSESEAGSGEKASPKAWGEALRRPAASSQGMSLSAQFAFAAAVVLCNGMALLGGWVATQIEKGLLHNTAVIELMNVQNLLEPVIPQLGPQLGSGDTAHVGDEIGRLLSAAPLSQRLQSVAIWLPDSTVVYSTDKTLVGKKFPQNIEVKAALKGNVRTALWDRRLLVGAANNTKSDVVRTVYAPIHDKDDKIVAVAEIADDALALRQQLESIRQRTWIVVGLSTLAMVLLLFVIVHKGSLTIEAQQLELERRFAEQKQLAMSNAELNRRLQDSNQRGIEIGEQLLKRVGTGLHDGPAQLLALALLRMHELKGDPQASGPQLGSVVDIVERATAGALNELRAISSDLMLPEIEKLCPEDVIWRAVQAHEASTGTDVVCEVSELPSQLPVPMTILIFRVVQEALRNAYRHAEGRGQTVTAGVEGNMLRLVVSDQGPGFSGVKTIKSNGQLGLRGLRQRVESIGGSFEIETAERQGTKLTVLLPIQATGSG